MKSKLIEALSAIDILNILISLPLNLIILTDIDDTIITPESKTFRKPPFNQLIDNIKNNKELYPNYEEIISNWRLQRKVMLIDNYWPSILNVLKTKYCMYGLTKMDTGKFGNIESMEKWRFLELKSLGIEFTDNTNIPQEPMNGAIFYHGIFITGPNSKSQTVSYYQDYLKANTFVLIDDREEHIKDMQRFCDTNSINFIGVLFKGLEKFNDVQDSKVALVQREHLLKYAKWLEDDEAQQLLSKDTEVER